MWWALIGAICAAGSIVTFRTRAEIIARTADAWTGRDSEAWIEDFISGNPHLDINVPDGRAIADGKRGVYMPRTPGARAASGSVVLEWPYGLVGVSLRDDRALTETPEEFRLRVVGDFREFSAVFPPKASQ